MRRWAAPRSQQLPRGSPHLLTGDCEARDVSGMMLERQNPEPLAASWGEALAELRPRLLRAARALIRTDDYDAEDLLQETVLRAIRYRPDLDEVNNPFYYLLGVMRNAWKDNLKSLRAAKEKTESLDRLIDEGWQAPVEPDAPREVEMEEARRELYKFLFRGMSPEEVHVLRLHYFDNYTTEEIAENMKQNVNVTRHKLNLMRAKIRYRLRKAGLIGTV